jgi:hypothetical protein
LGFDSSFKFFADFNGSAHDQSMFFVTVSQKMTFPAFLNRTLTKMGAALTIIL